MPDPIVYALPGTMCDARLWQRLLPQLPGVQWRHLPIPHDHSLDGLVVSLLDQLPVEPVNLLGFSLGGYLAALLTCRAPQRVARLMVCANSPRALPTEEIGQRQQLLNWVQKHGYQGLGDRKVAQMVSAENLADAGIGALMKAMDASLGEAALVQQLRTTTERQDLQAPLAGLAQPVHLVYGDQDRLVSRPWVEALAGMRPDFVIREVPGTGHMLPLEAPVATADAIRQWLR